MFSAIKQDTRQTSVIKQLLLVDGRSNIRSLTSNVRSNISYTMKVTNTSSRIMDVLNAQDCQKKSFERQLEKLLGLGGAGRGKCNLEKSQ